MKMLNCCLVWMKVQNILEWEPNIVKTENDMQETFLITRIWNHPEKDLKILTSNDLFKLPEKYHILFYLFYFIYHLFGFHNCTNGSSP